MSEMIERVATAIARRHGNYPTSDMDRMLARVAIEAMREPTEAMALAGDTLVDGIVPPLSNDVWRTMISAALSPSREDEK